MRTQISFAALILMMSAVGQATSVLKLDRQVFAFADYAAQSSILLISPDGLTDWYTNSRAVKGPAFKVADRDCTPLSQNTLSMDAAGGMTLAYPFLVGVDRVCYFDESTKTLRLLGRFSDQLPNNSFSAVYAGSDQSSVHFLVNGRVFPQMKTGYLFLVSVHKKTLMISTREIVNEVPGYSGGMFYENQNIWISTYPGRIFKIVTADLQSLISSGAKTTFSQIAAETVKGFEGLNGYMLASHELFYFYNRDDQSYTVNRQTRERKVVSTPCEPVAAQGARWLMLCSANSLELHELF